MYRLRDVVYTVGAETSDEPGQGVADSNIIFVVRSKGHQSKMAYFPCFLSIVNHDLHMRHWKTPAELDIGRSVIFPSTVPIWCPIAEYLNWCCPIHSFILGHLEIGLEVELLIVCIK